MKRKQIKPTNSSRKKQKTSSFADDEISTFSIGWNIKNFGDAENGEDGFEQEYEEQVSRVSNTKKSMLPIKSGDGLLHSVDLEVEEEQSEMESEDEVSEEDPAESKVITAVDLFTTQSKVLEQKKIEVGSLCAAILEAPEVKLHNFKTLFDLMSSAEFASYVTVKKLTIVSLLEVFKDVLPSYKVKESIDKGVKLKKDTLRLERYEVTLLQYYKKFLKILERTAFNLMKKRGSTRVLSKAQQNLAEIALNALCDLLVTHPYFNYAENIAQTIVPFVNHHLPFVREKVNTTCKRIFKDDKKGEITLKVLRYINNYAKKHSDINPIVIENLLYLRIKDVNLDEERENLLKQKKLMSHKNNVLKLSKMEKKRKARLDELEKELLEAKAEENKTIKKKHQTEITKLAFGIFFRVLKTSKNTKVLGVCLKGIAKFAHCINIEFYVDLINIIDGLLNADWLDYAEQQRCIQTVFVILSQQAEALNFDPTRFYNAAYKNLLTTHASNNYKDFNVVLETLTNALIKRHKKISFKRMASFFKRIIALSLQLLHNGTLACLGITKVLLQLNKALDVLLDVESSPGDGKYLPELEDPEYCNASTTSLFEVALLNRHYHPDVVEYTKYIASGVPVTESALSHKYGRTSAEQFFERYDTSKMAFYPPVPITKKVERKVRVVNHLFCDSRFKRECIDVVRNNV